MPALDVDQLIAALPAERISLLVTVPAVYSLVLRHKDFAFQGSVGWATGARRSVPWLVRAVKNALPQVTVFNGYGMTETASLMTAMPSRTPIRSDIRSFGAPWPDPIRRRARSGVSWWCAQPT